MSDIVFDDPCVLFALQREAAAFLQEFRPHERVYGSPCQTRFCGPEWLSVLVLETGVGQGAAEKALAWLETSPKIENVPCRPKIIISAGFAGGLQEPLKPGDIVLATDVVDAAGNVWPTTWPRELPPGDWNPPLRRGRVLTTTQLIGQPEEKRRLGTQHQALAVDMESAVIARWCQKHGIPFGCVRAISDDVVTPLSPKLLNLLARGRVSMPALVAAVAMSPGLVREFWRLAQHTKKAAGQLGKALGELLTLTLDWAN